MDAAFAPEGDKPQVKVIFTSGYHNPDIQARCEREGIQALISNLSN